MMAPRKKLGEMLISEGLIDEIQLRSAIGHQKNWGGKLGSALIELGFLREEDIARVLEEQLKHRCLSGKELRPEPEALKLISMQDAIKYDMIPLKLNGPELTIAMSNPYDFAVTDELGFRLGKRIKGVLAVEASIKKAIKACYGGDNIGRDYREMIKPVETGQTAEIIHNESKFRDYADHAPRPEAAPEVKRVEPSPELVAKALAFLLIEKGVIKRDELIEKMKSLKDKGLG
jgi:type IV pilus assembly protein PilB